MLLAWVWLVVAHGSEGAQPSVDLAAESELHFDLGVAAYKEGRFEDALQHLLRSHRLVPNRKVAFNIARAYEQLERYDPAWRYYADVVRTEADADARALAEDALERIADRVARVEVTSEPPGATVYVDRVDLGARGATPVTLALPSGEHTVFVGDGAARSAEAVTAETGALATVAVALPASTDPPAPGATSADPGPTWSAAVIQTAEVVLLAVTGERCTVLPGRLDASSARIGSASSTPGGSAAAAHAPVEGLVVDWNVADDVWRQTLRRPSKTATWLADAAALRPLLAACDPSGVDPVALGNAVAGLSTPGRRDAVALLAEWAAVRAGTVGVEAQAACVRRDCRALAELVVGPQ